MACLSSAESAHVNPWSLPWRTLSTDQPCHLRDLLSPLPRTALPPSLRMEEGGEVGESDTQAPSSNAPTVVGSSVSGATPVRFGRLIVGGLAQRAVRKAGDAPEEQEVIALLGLRLTPCQWRIMRLLLAHPLLSAEELAAFLRLRRPSARRSLYELHGLGCLEPIATTAGKRWHLCGRGLRLLASAEHVHIRNMATWPENTAVTETANAVQRGEAGILQYMRHNAGMYGFFARLTQAALREAGQALCWWETGPVCERRYQVNEQWYNLQA